jgi:hypothetical protein
MLCYIDVLISADAEAGGKLEQCQSQVVNTDHLTIVVPELAEKRDEKTLLAMDVDNSVAC